MCVYIYIYIYIYIYSGITASRRAAARCTDRFPSVKATNTATKRLRQGSSSSSSSCFP